MALSGRARDMAAEIRLHDWSDAHSRLDRAGHQHDNDSPSKRQRQLTPEETDYVRMNVVWVTGQALLYEDPTLNFAEYAEACGVSGRLLRNKDGAYSGALWSGIRLEPTPTGEVTHRPGTYSA